MSSLLRKGLVQTNEKEVWQSGTIVWSLFCNQWWPSMVITLSNYVVNDRRAYVVFWFGDSTISKVFASNIIPFVANYKVVYDAATMRKPWLKAVNETIHELLGRKDEKKNKLHKWAYSNLLNLTERVDVLVQFIYIEILTEVPDWIKNVLRKHSESFESLAIMTIDQFMACTIPLPIITRCELSSDQQKIVSKCKTQKEGLYGYCLSCYSSHVEEEHPFFVGHLCFPCLEDLKSVIKYQKTFASLKYCTVCADTMNASIVCCNDRCSKAYCKKCIKQLSGATTVEKLSKNKHFECFLCKKEVKKNILGMLRPRFDFKNKVENLLLNDSISIVNCSVLNEPITVLSIDDSMQIGLKALKELNVPVQSYYVVNSYSTVSDDSVVKDLGYLRDITASVLESIGPIHLIIIGSRSISNSKNIQIAGFYEFFRVINLVKECCCQEFFWFFEAPASFDIGFKIIVNRFFQCKPIKLIEQEERLFWGNLLTLSDEKYMDFRNKYGSASKDSESSNSNDRAQLSSEELFLIHNNQWNLEFFKHLLGFLSDFYHE